MCLWQQFLYGHQELSSPQNILAPKGAWGHNYLLSLELRRPLLLMWYLAAPCLCPIWTWQKSGRRRCLCSLHIKRERLLSVSQKIGTFSLPSFHQPREVHLSPRSFCAPNSWPTGAAAFYALARFSTAPPWGSWVHPGRSLWSPSEHSPHLCSSRPPQSQEDSSENNKVDQVELATSILKFSLSSTQLKLKTDSQIS